MTKQERLCGIAAPLLAWYDANKRDLPWRGDPDPYKVWVSEIMLQQTRVAAVLPYYRAWMEELPTVAALAEADEEKVMKLWQGLGYYSRARNLQKAARMILEKFGGEFPETFRELLELPGVGRYTAGAIASIAFGEPVPAVDGNVLRVAARLAEIREDILEPKVWKRIYDLMESAIPADRPGEFNQALMDLGAGICLANTPPLCECCPLAELCEANRLGIQQELPVRKKKSPRRVEEMTVYLLLKDGKLALRQREKQGLLAGLWEFPHVPRSLDEEHAAAPVEAWGLTPLEWKKKLKAKHLFSHVEWHMTGYLLTVRGEAPELTWVDGPGLEALAVPSAFAKFLEEARRVLAEVDHD